MLHRQVRTSITEGDGLQSPIPRLFGTETMKTCTRCGESKSLDDFGNDKRYGKKAACKECRKIAAREYKPKLKSKTPLNRARQMWKSMKRRCKKGEGCYAGIEVRMSREEWMAWAVPKIEAFTKQHPDKIPSVDREDPDGHYELRNVSIMDLKDNQLRSRLLMRVARLDPSMSHEEKVHGIVKVVRSLSGNLKIDPLDVARYLTILPGIVK